MTLDQDLSSLEKRLKIAESCDCGAVVPRDMVQRIIDRLRADRWTPCEKRMPDPGEIVIFEAMASVCVGPYRPEHQRWDDLLVVDMCGDCDHYSIDQVTRWRPMPTLSPEER